MYVEILCVGPGLDPESSGSESRIYVGPFDSEEERDSFTNLWTRRLQESSIHNVNQVKFLSCFPPENWSAIAPKDFQGFGRITAADIENFDGED